MARKRLREESRGMASTRWESMQSNRDGKKGECRKLASSVGRAERAEQSKRTAGKQA